MLALEGVDVRRGDGALRSLSLIRREEKGGVKMVLVHGMVAESEDSPEGPVAGPRGLVEMVA